MSFKRLQNRGGSYVFDSLEDKLSLSSMLGHGSSTIVYSDPTAPPEPDPGPFPGDTPIGYPTPVPGGPIGPAAAAV